MEVDMWSNLEQRVAVIGIQEEWFLDTKWRSGNVFEKLIWRPKQLLIWHSTVFSLGQMAQLITIILSLTALIVC